MNVDVMWGNLLAQLGIASVLAFFMWHLISKSVPDLITGFREELAQERRERTEQTNRFAQCIDRLTVHIDNLTEKVQNMQHGGRHTVLQHPAERKS